ncbi:MAG: RluA family pseudouridine synthase [Myxococcaceae bacterium]
MKRRSVRVDTASSLRRLLAAELKLSEADAGRLVEQGAAYVQGRRCRDPEAKLMPGQVVTAVTEERGQGALEERGGPPRLRVLFEDAAVLAVDKPAGVVTQPTPSRVGDSLLDAASAYLGKPAGLVHRLDRETSGVVVFGKTKDATSALAAAFREGTARKTYLAVTSGPVPARGTIDLQLSRDPARIGRWRASRTANGLPAVTDYERLSPRGEEQAAFSIVRLFPKTGRTHQLRAHLTALGAPIAGDGLYGGASTLGGIAAPRCLLHAATLELPHPNPRTGKSLRIESPPPEDLQAFLRAAGVDAIEPG